METSISQKPSVIRKFDWPSVALLFGFILLLILAIWMIATQVAGSLSQERQARAIAAFEEETGIRILRVALTAGGGVIDLQYQVVDPDKALIVHDDENPPTLLDVDSGLVIAEPFHEHSSRELHTAVTYHQMIMNGGGLLERGSEVTLTVGRSRLEKIHVQ